MNPSARLNKDGLLKLLPFLGDLAFAYEDHGGLVLTVENGHLRVDSPTPLVLIDEARKDGITLVCTGIDDRSSFFDVYIEQEVPTIMGTSAPGIETDVHKAEPVGAAALEKMKVNGKWVRLKKGSTKEKQMIDKIIQHIDDKFEKFEEKFGLFDEFFSQFSK